MSLTYLTTPKLTIRRTEEIYQTKSFTLDLSRSSIYSINFEFNTHTFGFKYSWFDGISSERPHDIDELLAYLTKTGDDKIINIVDGRTGVDITINMMKLERIDNHIKFELPIPTEIKQKKDVITITNLSEQVSRICVVYDTFI
jgi:hypothetical protein